jgi:1-acyl-sn-glycerol-3-phosphate acyltransferase
MAVMTDRLAAAWDSPRPSRGTRAFYAVGRGVLVGFCRGWLRLRVEGREKVPAEGPFILAPVHRSNLDTPIVAALTHRPLRYLGKDSLWKANRGFAWVLSALGGLPVARGSADREALRRCQVILEAGQPLVLFPEGTRRYGPVVDELFDGPAYLATKLGVPIVPVGIGGSEGAQQKGRKLIRPVKVCVIAGDPIAPPAREDGRATSRRAVKALTEQLQVEIQKLFDEARSRVGD